MVPVPSSSSPRSSLRERADRCCTPEGRRDQRRVWRVNLRKRWLLGGQLFGREVREFVGLSCVYVLYVCVMYKAHRICLRYV